MGVGLTEEGVSTHLEQPLHLELASSGQEGYRKLEQALGSGEPYSVVLLDMRMPNGLNGLETAEKIRSIDEEVRIIFVSALRDFSTKEIRERIGMNFDYLQKPVESAELEQLVLSNIVQWQQKRELVEAYSQLRKCRHYTV